ncbi:hypothetical protein JW921_03735 [Candidatus Fermentibacterales bacterium]|nr:hypothetical protein [Candidatus Fermentibacterales bacterium]
MMNGSQSSFEGDVRETMSLVRGVFGEVFRALPETLRSAHEVHKAFGVDRKLGWKVFKMVTDEDIFLAAQFVPGPGACAKFLRKASARGLDSSLIDGCKKALGDFSRMVERHAGDRAAFDLMLLSCSEKGMAQAYRSQQKAAFVAYSHLLGVQARTQFCTWVFGLSDDRMSHDIIALRGFVDLRRNRPNVPWLMEQARFTDDDGNPDNDVAVRPLVGAAADGSPLPAPFYHEFCSSPLPQVIGSVSKNGRFFHELAEGPLGDTEAMTCVTAQVARAVFPAWRTDQDRFREILALSRTPVEALILDQVAHRDLLGPHEPELFAFGEFTGHEWAESAEHRNPHGRLPIDARVQMLGWGAAAGFTALVPRYVEMLEDVFRRMGWDGSDFAVHRAVIEYPVIPSTVNMRTLLPEKPAEEQS